MPAARALPENLEEGGCPKARITHLPYRRNPRGFVGRPRNGPLLGYLRYFWPPATTASRRFLSGTPTQRLSVSRSISLSKKTKLVPENTTVLIGTLFFVSIAEALMPTPDYRPRSVEGLSEDPRVLAIPATSALGGSIRWHGPRGHEPDSSLCPTGKVIEPKARRATPQVPKIAVRRNCQRCTQRSGPIGSGLPLKSRQVSGTDNWSIGKAGRTFPSA